MSKLTQKQLQNQVDKFNKAYQSGDKVEVQKWKGSSETFTDEIKHEATILGGHTAITWLKGKGSFDLSFVVRKI